MYTGKGQLHNGIERFGVIDGRPDCARFGKGRSIFLCDSSTTFERLWPNYERIGPFTSKRTSQHLLSEWNGTEKPLLYALRSGRQGIISKKEIQSKLCLPLCD